MFVIRTCISGINNVIYKGAVQPQDIYNVLSASDVLVLPTYYPGEGYPGIIIEAYAAEEMAAEQTKESIKKTIEQRKQELAEKKLALTQALCENQELAHQLRHSTSIAASDSDTNSVNSMRAVTNNNSTVSWLPSYSSSSRT